MLIHRDALAVSGVTASGNFRYYLNGAMFDDQGRAVATDGHLLVRFTSLPINPSRFPVIDGLDTTIAKQVIIEGEALKAASRTMGKEDAMAIVPNGTHVTLATANGNRRVQVTTPNVEGVFPEYERILSVKHPVVATVIFSPDILSRLAHVAQQINARSITFTLHAPTGVCEVNDQVVFTAQGTNGTLDGALMPMRQ